MEEILPDEKKAEKQRIAKNQAKAEADRKKEYFKLLSQDSSFKKYILEDIINTEIKNHTSIGDDILEMVKLSPEEVKALLVAKTGAVKAVKVIKDKILCNF